MTHGQYFCYAMVGEAGLVNNTLHGSVVKGGGLVVKGD